ncbi:MAG TPA: sugar ABC transporter ATP-binding protein [Ktedonobacterales bacterium]
MSALRAEGITKSFSGVAVLRDVTLDVQGGRIVALVGENGAGKSTLMNILAGALRPDSGSILIDGQPQQFHTVTDAVNAGISIIYQELNVFLNLSIAENFLIGNESAFAGPGGLIDRRALDQAVKETLASVGLRRKPDELVGALGVGERQLVEIGKALRRQSRFLILDEPTAALTGQETSRLFEILRSLRERGVGVIYISHRLAEVFELANSVVVLRDGQVVAARELAQTTEDDLVELMVGRQITNLYPRVTTEPGAVALRLDHVSTAKAHDISLTVRAGEVVGLGGMMGSGRTEVARAIAGLDRITAGTLELAGKPVTLRGPRAALAAGVAFLTEDRKYDGLILPFSIQQNLALPSLKTRQRFSWIAEGEERAFAQRMRERLRIKLHSLDQPVERLSGGNQQKVALGKWLEQNPTALVLDEPTRGVDVGAKQEIYSLMNDLKRQGKAILMISSDLPELLGMSDRVYVMRDYTVAGELDGHDITQVEFMRFATGGK